MTEFNAATSATGTTSPCIRALAFDVFGTVVDWRGGIANEAAAIAANIGAQADWQAFADAWAGSELLRGVYFWNYYGWGGRASIGYTPRHKPAAEEMERYFLREAARPAR